MKTSNAYFCVLDIETSTYFESNIPKAVWLAYGYLKVYNTKNENILKYYFREWGDLRQYFLQIKRRFMNTRLICYVHNLAYEFDFLLKNISDDKKILANSSHKVILAELKDIDFIQFRCSYLLSGYSLKKVGEMVNLPKLESEYRTIYPSDKVTDEEKYYCERDCDIVAKYICDIMLKEYKMLTNIPYTKTGRVRKVLGKFYEDEIKPVQWDLMPPENCYQAMLRAFQGGIAISNPLFTGCEIKNVRSFDETSAYPYAMLKEEYPYTIEKLENFNKENLKEKFWIAKIRFNKIYSKFTWGWLSISKMDYPCVENSIYFNGKLIEAEYVERTITNIDFEIITQTYNFESIELIEFYRLENYSKLPNCYIKTIEKYAVLKGKLKDELKTNNSTELQRDYMLAKNDFNSIYGMTVQKLVHESYEIDENFNWKEKKTEYKQTKEHIKRNFLFGIYVTAYARRNLIRGILKNCPYTFIYADTDSIKCLLVGDFIDTNEPLHEYSDNKYIKDLGKFEEEKTYTNFKTFGAKKYCYSYDNCDNIMLTVAGLPKSVLPIKSMDEFKCGKIFENCKLATKYFNGNIYYEYDDENTVIMEEESKELLEFYQKNNIESCGGVMLYPTSYELNITNQDRFYINYLKGVVKQWQRKIQQESGILLTDYCPMVAVQMQ